MENASDKKIVTETEAESANNGSGVSYYEDEEISIIWTDAQTRLEFKLRNKTNEMMVLHWSEVRYINYNGAESPVIRSGIRYYEKDGWMEDTYISGGGCLSDLILPSMNVYFNENHKKKKQHGWIELEFFPYGKISDRKTEWQKGLWQKRTIRILMPISIKGVKKNYIFEFGIYPENLEVMGKAVHRKPL